MSLKRFLRLHLLLIFICGTVGLYLRLSRHFHSMDYFGVLNYGISEDMICNIEHLLAGIGLSALLVLGVMLLYVAGLSLIWLASAGNVIPLLALTGVLLYVVGAYIWEFPSVTHTNLGNQFFFDVIGMVIYCLIWMQHYYTSGTRITKELKAYVASKMSNIQ